MNAASKSPAPWAPIEIEKFIKILIGHAKAAGLPMTVAALEFAEFSIREERNRDRTKDAD